MVAALQLAIEMSWKCTWCIRAEYLEYIVAAIDWLSLVQPHRWQALELPGTLTGPNVDFYAET